MKRHLLVLAALILWVGSLSAQSNFINQDSVFARTSDCALGVSVCIDSIAYDNINDLRFYVNGQQFSSQFTPCLVNTVHNYSYSDIFRGGEGGPWRLDSWTVNGQTYTGRFNNLQNLLDSMRRWNPSGNWQLENSARIIYGYVAASTTYSCQEIFGTQKGGQSQVCYNSGIEYRGLRFSVPVGIHQLIVEKVRTGERDTVTLLAACLKPETIRRTVAVGSSATYCASQADLLGRLVSTRNYCTRPANAITFNTPQATCFTYRANVIGVDSACIQVCDRYGFCDTTYLIVNAVQPSGNSLTFSDTISVGFGRTTCEVALPTGRITTFTNICPQNSGTNVNFELDPGTSCVTYRGLVVGTNTACIRACNESGTCDTTSITIRVIPYVAPRPITRFTYTDTITVGVTRPKCSFNAPVGAIATFENICAAASGSKVSFTLNQATKCVSYRGVAVGLDSACIRVCNASGQCDTTVLYITGVRSNGSSGSSGRTITVRDTISIGRTRENCGVSIPSTAISIVNNCPSSSGTNVAFSLDEVRRCVTYRGLTVGEDTACYVACNSNGICDTTIYIVGTVDANQGKKITIRDTISVGLTRNNCAVSIPNGIYASITNDCVGSSGTNVTFNYSAATRCVDYSGILVGSDTACIKVCNTNGVCDTTIYIITAVENTTGGGGNNCGLRVAPFVQARNCGIKGFITLAVSGSTAPYSFRWADLTGASQPQNRTELEAGNYTVTVSSASSPTCDTTLTITVINNATNCGGGGGGNRCGLAVVPTAVNKTCTANGSITLAVSGSTAPYSFNWADLTGTTDPQNRTNLEAGIYSVTVTPSVANCDTVIAVVIANNATNCGGGSGNRCGLAVVPTVTPKTCTGNGSITLAVSGSTAPYTFDWADLTGTNDPQNRSTLEAGTYTVKVTPSVPNCDTSITVVVANNASNCGGTGSNIRQANVTVRVQDSITFCVDSSRVLGGFTVAFSSPQAFSVISEGTPKGCFKIKGFVVGSDVAVIILTGQNGVKDTTQLTINVTPRITGGNGCGLVVNPTVTPKTCAANGAITLAVSGSTTPYTFDWADVAGTSDTQNRSDLQAGTYTVKVSSSAANCDTTLTLTVLDNCVINRCGLVVTPTATPKTCAGNGSISLAVSGSTAPYTFDWSDLTGTTDPQNRTNLEMGIYTVKVSSSVAGCDTTLSVAVANNATNCGGGGGSNIRLATVTVIEGDSTTYCIDSSRVTGGFTVQLSGITQIFSTLAQTTPVGCFKIKGFVAGRDSVTIIAVGQNGVRDTTKLTTIVTPRNTGGGGCGLVVRPTVTPKTCAANGSITLAVSGSTAPYTFDWTDIVGTVDTQNRVNLPPGSYTVKVKSAAANCDTTLTLVVADNCLSNRCGLVVSPTIVPKTCTADGSIVLTVTGSTAPYTFDWTDIVGTLDSQNRARLAAGTYTVKVTPSVLGCDTTLTIVVANNATNCGGGGSNIRLAAVTVKVGDSTTYCVDSSRVTGGFTVQLSGISQDFSTLSQTTPVGCFRVKGFVAGRDSVTIILIGQNGVRDTTKLTTIVTPITTGGGSNIRLATVTVKTGDSTTYCVDSSRVVGGFTVELIGISQTFSTLEAITPRGCFKIKGFIVGRDSVNIILVGQNGVRDTTKLTINIIPRDILGGGCGLVVRPTVTPKTCAANGSITLAVSGSTAPYTFDWTDIVGTVDTQNRVNLPPGSYTVKVKSAAANCDTTLTLVVADNCLPNRCGLVVSPAVMPKTCTADGSIILTVTGSSAPYTFDWTDIVGTVDSQNRARLAAGTYTVKVTPSVSGCDTTLSIVVANNATNCNGGAIRFDNVNVVAGDSTVYCADTTRVGTGFAIELGGSQDFSTTGQTTPKGCFKIKGFLVGRDSMRIVLVSTSGVRDTLILRINVTPRPSCGLVVTPTIVPRNCTTNGAITLAVSGSTAPYTFDWLDIVGAVDTQNRVNLTAGIYTVKVKSATTNCDTTLTIVVADNCVPNRCGLIVSPTATPKTCTSNGSITLTVTGSTAPYTFDWSDITGTVDSQNRTGLAAGLYTVKVTPSVAGCDTTLTIRVGNEASNCGGNTCGLVVTPTAVPKQCIIRGSISLNVSGGTAPYSYKWADLRDTFPRNRTNLEAGIYSVSVTSASAGCDTTLRITVANDSTGCGSRTFHKDSVTVFVQDSARYCADSSRVGTGFVVNLFSTTTPIYSVIAESTPTGCFKVKGFVAGRDTVFIILIGQNGTRDTTQLFVKVVPKVIIPTGGTRSDTITIKTLEIRNYCPDTSRLVGSPVNLIKFCSTDPFDNTSIRLDTIQKCVAVKGLRANGLGVRVDLDTFCIAVCNVAGFCDTTKLFVRVTPDTVTPVLRIDTVRVFVGDSLTYCNIDTGQIRGNVDTIYNICPSSSGTNAKTELNAAKCLKVSGLVEGTDTACIVVCNRVANLCDTTRVIIIVSKRPSNVLIAREDSITIQVGEIRNYCPDTSRLRGNRVTSISFCSTATFDNAVILLVDSTKCAKITGALIGQDTACLVVCTATGLCDTVKLKVKVVPERPIKDTTIVVPIGVGKDSLFCNVDTTQIRGLVDTIYDACPGKNGSFARMVIDRVTHCVRITGVRIGKDTMCVVVCNTLSRRCDTTRVIADVRDSITSNIVVIANDDFDSLRRGQNKVLEVYNNDTIRPRRATSLKITRPPVKGRADTISFRDGLIKYTATRAPSACGLDSFRYRVCIDSICDTALVVIRIVCPDSLRAYNAISPNGDGRNDVFLIDGLQNYPDHTVCIFNRWGNQVLNQKNYQNDWSGTWNGVNVPDGTYFYFIRDDKKGEMVLTGYLQVVR